MLDTILPANEAVADRVIRVLAGAALVALVFVGPHTPWGWLGAILVVTGLMGRCPLYRLFGISTLPKS
jgi:Inner membrane protein YgaP-like, transmembrane domain